jgi:integrase
MTNFAKVSERDNIKPRRDPFWTKVSKGCYLGYRKMTSASDGTWLARYLDVTTGKQNHKPLGDFSELPKSERYLAAKEAAEAWFEHLGRGGSTKVMTVAQCCDHYVEYLKREKGADSQASSSARARFDSFILKGQRLAGVELSKLQPAHLIAWRRAVAAIPAARGARRGEQRSDSTLNRDMTTLRAALNLAVTDRLVTSDFAWRNALKPIKNADRRRDLYIDPQQRRHLIVHANEDFADFLRGLCLIPLRPGALAALKVGNYDKRLKTLTVAKDKAGQDRKITLPDATADFFARLSKDKLPGAYLFNRTNLMAWNRESWKYPMKLAVKASALPAGVTCYTIRHSVITDLIHSGLDSLTVAQLSGTSMAMIEKHYGHLTQDHAREALSRLVV